MSDEQQSEEEVEEQYPVTKVNKVSGKPASESDQAQSSTGCKGKKIEIPSPKRKDIKVTKQKAVKTTYAGGRRKAPKRAK